VNDNKYSFEQKGDIKRKFLFWTHLVFLIGGICCCLQFLIIGLIGVVRGYPIESYLPFHIMLIGSIILVFLGLTSKKSIVWVLGFFSLICPSIIENQQTSYHIKGEEFYAHKQYEEAIKEFRKETETWYLRFAYNAYEVPALNRMVKSYCQLGDFNEALNILSLIAKRHPGVSNYYANKEIARIEAALIKVNNIDTSSLEKQTDIVVLYDLARTYRYDLGCDAKAIEIYKRIVNMPIDDKLKEEAKQAIQVLK
jgi:pentatricopeptide repeat protein